MAQALLVLSLRESIIWSRSSWNNILPNTRREQRGVSKQTMSWTHTGRNEVYAEL